MLHKKRIAALLAAVSLLALVGCGDSQDSTAEESSTESIETTVLETEPTTEATTTVVTTTESDIKSVPVYEENENITSILKKAYTLNGQEPPEIKFDWKNNTYNVILNSNFTQATVSESKENGELETLESSVEELSKTMLETIKNIDDSADMCFYYLMENNFPFIVFENQTLSFSFLDAETSDFVVACIKSSDPTYDVTYDSTKNCYTVNVMNIGVAKENFISGDEDKKAKVDTTFSNLEVALTGFVATLDDDATVVMQLLDYETGEPLITFENGTINHLYEE